MKKKIVEADENIFVTEDGEVFHNNKKLKYRFTKNGYARVQYKVNGKYVDRYVHRLVAELFIPNPNNYPCVNHINGDKNKNNVGNLEWCTYKMNMIHASTHGLINKSSELRKEKCKENQLNSVEVNSKPMVEYDENGNYVKEYTSGSNALYRLSYKNHFYRDKQILIQQYGCVPKEIPIKYIELARNHKRRIFIGVKDGIEYRYEKLADLPCTREQFYFAYNHCIPDVNGYKWTILIHF